MSGQRKALIIANDEYEQEGLRNLQAPAADAEALARVLSDPRIGDFDVEVIHNSPNHVIQARIEDLFTDSKQDDLLLLHYSGHGLKTESQELFLAACNTRPTRLRATGVSADFVQQCMHDSRSGKIVLFLDCCFAGAYLQGSTRDAGDVDVLDSFSREKSGGRGRAVITASRATELAWDEDRFTGGRRGQPSVFTSALVEGLYTGDADHDEDGWVTLAELYRYVFDKVREVNPHQTPGCRLDMEGDFRLARSGRLRISPARHPPDLQDAISSTNMIARLGAVGELRARLASDELPVAASAYESLAELARNDIRYVAESASAALGEAMLRPEPAELTFGPAEQGSVPEHRVVRLLGPPIARTCVPRSSDPQIRVDQVPDGLDVSVDTGATGVLNGSITLKGPTGVAVIAVHSNVIPAVTVTAAAPEEAALASLDTLPDTPPREVGEQADAGHRESLVIEPQPPLAAATETLPTPAAVPAPAPVAAAGAASPSIPPGHSGGTAAASRAPTDTVEPPRSQPEGPRQEEPRPQRRILARRAVAKTPVTDAGRVGGTVSSPAFFLLAALGCRLIVLCVGAVVSFSHGAGYGLGYGAIILSILGILLTLPDVLKSWLIASILLWDQALSIVYWWAGIEGHQYNVADGYSLLTNVCLIAASGDVLLLAWAIGKAVKGHRASGFLALFAALTAIANLVAASAWSAQPSVDMGPWNVLGVIAIATVLAGLVATRAFRYVRTIPVSK